MPEYPDITIYIERLESHVGGKTLQKLRIANPFLLRTFDPPISTLNGRTIKAFRRIGKQIVFEFEDDLFLVLHLMISGRLYWKEANIKIPAKKGLAAFDFDHGSLLLTEVATKKRASLNLIKGEAGLAAFDRGGLNVFEINPQQFHQAITAENHTLKRTLTDQRILSGIGNAYSDEILHRAQLSPILQTNKISEGDSKKLHKACLEVLTEWCRRLSDEIGEKFPEKVTAFHPEMAVHGKYERPCPVCESPVQRIRYATNETNYCARCQTSGKRLADRALSRLLKKDWPRDMDAL